MLGVIRDGSGQHTPPLPAPVLLQHSYRPGVMVLIMARTKEGGGGGRGFYTRFENHSRVAVYCIVYKRRCGGFMCLALSRV